MAEDKKVENKDGGEMVGLSIQDIVLSANIIDLATQRGAFKAAEAGQVGACFEKLVAFIKANTPKKEEDDKADAKADAGTDSSSEADASSDADSSDNS